MTDRAEHLAWCKQRALEYLDAGDVRSAIASLLSDLNKHPDTKYLPAEHRVRVGMDILYRNDAVEMRRWIEEWS